MPIRYIDLIEDHDGISQRAATLLATVDDGSSDAGDIAVALQALGAFVRYHLAAEAPLVDALDKADLKGPWLATWQNERENYQSLRSDWQQFLNEWDAPTISGDMQGFQSAVHAILDRLEARVRMETKMFYAVALQTGSVQFYLT